jgi:hypothetical protein
MQVKECLLTFLASSSLASSEIAPATSAISRKAFFSIESMTIDQSFAIPDNLILSSFESGRSSNSLGLKGFTSTSGIGPSLSSSGSA